MSRDTMSKKEIYINGLFAEENEYKRKIREQLKADGKWGINVGPYEGRLLQVLTGLANAKKVIEVGTLYGYSTLWMAEALPEDGKIISLESESEHHAKASALLQPTPQWSKIDLRCGDALASLATLRAEGPFDMIFIDANKGGYVDYLDWAEENIRQGGLILGDNTFLFGHMTGEASSDSNMGIAAIETMAEFNRRLANPERYRSVLIPTAEGLTVAQKLN